MLSDYEQGLMCVVRKHVISLWLIKLRFKVMFIRCVTLVTVETLALHISTSQQQCNKLLNKGCWGGAGVVVFIFKKDGSRLDIQRWARCFCFVF